MSVPDWLWLLSGLLLSAAGLALCLSALLADPIRRWRRPYPRCPRCEYNLSAAKLADASASSVPRWTCPECGASGTSIRQLTRPRVRVRLAILSLALLATGLLVALQPVVASRGWYALVPHAVKRWIWPYASDRALLAEIDSGVRQQTLTGSDRTLAVSGLRRTLALDADPAMVSAALDLLTRLAEFNDESLRFARARITHPDPAIASASVAHLFRSDMPRADVLALFDQTLRAPPALAHLDAIVDQLADWAPSHPPAAELLVNLALEPQALRTSLRVLLINAVKRVPVTTRPLVIARLLETTDSFAWTYGDWILESGPEPLSPDEPECRLAVRLMQDIAQDDDPRAASRLSRARLAGLPNCPELTRAFLALPTAQLQFAAWPYLARTRISVPDDAAPTLVARFAAGDEPFVRDLLIRLSPQAQSALVNLDAFPSSKSRIDLCALIADLLQPAPEALDLLRRLESSITEPDEVRSAARQALRRLGAWSDSPNLPSR